MKNNFQFKAVRLPAWAMPFIAVAAIAIVLIAALFGLTLMLLLLPVALIAGIAARLFGQRGATMPPRPTSAPERRAAGRSDQIIEGDYEVIEQDPKQGG